MEHTVYVADAHALGWYFTDDPRLGPPAAQIFERSECGEYLILVPTIVMAELFHIGRKKRIALHFADFLRTIEEKSNFTVTTLDMDVIKKLPDTFPLNELHDQIIVITALLYEAPVPIPDFIVDRWVEDMLQGKEWDENTVLTIITDQQQNPFTIKETMESLDADWDSTAEVLNQIDALRELLDGW
jgi:hypothetical protein